MLKIKDNVDLKELEKYGLYYKGVIYEDKIIFPSNEECLCFAGLEYKKDDLNILFDLIKDGLVEKVE